VGFFVKKSNTGSSDWANATSIYVKVSTGWTAIKKGFIKVSSGWSQFWPKSGPITTTSPLISTIANDLSGTSQPSGYTLNYGTTYYGQHGIWDTNAPSTTISSYSYIVYTSTSGTTFSGPYSIMDSGSVTGSSVTIPLTYGSTSGTTYDGKYLIFSITATRSDGVIGSDDTDSQNYRYFVMRKYAPTQTASSPIISISPSSTTTTQTGGILTVRGAPYTITYQGYWNGDSDYLPDSSRNNISWYSSTNGNYITAAQVVANATKITTGISTSTPTNNGTTYTTNSTLTLSSIANGTYIYVVDNQQNSNTDWYSTNGTSALTLLSGVINTAPTPTVQPTITATTPSGYNNGNLTGNANSFTVGATISGNTGTWSITPNGTYPVVSSFKYSSTSSITNQNNWNAIYTPTLQGGFQDSIQNQNHSFTLGSVFYTNSLGTSSFNTNGLYLEYTVTAENGNGASSSSDFWTNSQLIHDAPYSTTFSMTYTSNNNANVYITPNASYYYQLQYSANGSTGWTNIGTIQYASTIRSLIALGQSYVTYSELPNNNQYYRLLCYNDDNVYITSSSLQFNSTPPPSTPTFSYYYGSQSFDNGFIQATSTGATSITATVYRSASVSWGTTITFDTASSNTNTLWYEIPLNGYYYIYVTATNSYGSTSAYSIVNNTQPFYAGVPIGTTAQSVSASTSILKIDLSWTPANWKNTAPYHGDNITYTNNISSFEVYRSTSSSTPSNTVTPTYSGLTGISYADTTVSSGTRYYYWIRGRNNDTYSGWQSMGNAITGSVPSNTVAPYWTDTSNVAISSPYYPGTYRFNFGTWNGSPTTYYYQFLYNNVGGTAIYPSSGYASTTATYIDYAFVANSSSITAAVYAVNSFGASVNSYPPTLGPIINRPVTVTTYPSLSGTGQARTNITFLQGTYQNASTITTTLMASISLSFSTSSTSKGSTSPYTITDNDAAGNPYYFAVLDTVVGTNGTTYYFWSGGFSGSSVTETTSSGGAILSYPLPFTINSYPTISGSGAYPNTVTGAHGTYTNATIQSTSTLLWIYSASTTNSFSYSYTQSGTPTGTGSYSSLTHAWSTTDPAGNPAHVAMMDVVIGTDGITRYIFSGGTSTTSPTGVVSITDGSGAIKALFGTIITAPTYSTATSTSGGFTASVNNTPNPSGGTYSATTSAGSVSIISSTGQITVTGLTGGQSATVTVTYSVSGYTSSTINVTGSALSNLVAPTPTSLTKSGSNFSVYFSGGSGPYYQVWWQSTSGQTTTTGYDANGSSSPITVTNLTSLTSGTTYYFSVRSVSALTNTGYTSGGSTTISDWSSSQVSYYSPIIPTISMSANSGIGQAQATINWTSTNQSYAYVGSTYVGNVTSYTFTGLSAGTFYSGSVTVYSSDGYTASASYSFTTQAASQVCVYNDYGSYYYSSQCYTIPPATYTGTGSYTVSGSCCPNINKTITKWNCLATDVTNSSSPDYFNCYSTGQCAAVHAAGRTACAWRA